MPPGANPYMSQAAGRNAGGLEVPDGAVHQWHRSLRVLGLPIHRSH